MSFSTEQSYERIGKLEAKLYQSALTESLPEYLENIREIASKIENEVDCIDTIVSHLIDKIPYLGTWNISEGQLAPRSLQTIISSGYGDCKESAVCLAAILNKLGYQAKIAIVNRNNIHLEKDNLPNHGYEFNHAIVKAVGPSGKTYWVDPTNIVTMANGIFPDIADRPALVLDLENPSYERVPPQNHQHSIWSSEKIITIAEGETVKATGSLRQEGESALNLTQVLYMHPLSLVKEGLIRLMCTKENPPDTYNVDFLETPSRKVQPVNVTYSYEEDHAMTHTNYGNAFPLTGFWYAPYIAVSPKDEGALYAGNPETIIKKSIFKNVSAEHLDKLAFSIQTPWLNARRDLSNTEEGVVVTEVIEILKSIIPASDLKSEEYKKLKNTLRKYCDGIEIIFSK